MPIKETDIQYEYPKTEGERLALIGKHAKEGRMWVSSSRDSDDRFRMKFCAIGYEKALEAAPVEDLPPPITIPKPSVRKRPVRKEKNNLIRYAGYEKP